MTANHQENPDPIFDDFEARSNIIGLYDLLLKIDRRINPRIYQEKIDKEQYDRHNRPHNP